MPTWAYIIIYMDRFSEQLPSNLKHKMKIWGDEPLFSVAVNTCHNCGQTCNRLTPAPDDFNFLACDDCMEECMRVLAAEAIENFHASKIEPQQARLFSKQEVA